MRLPNPLASRNGRLAAFFALYMTEGIPLGFTATAIATQMRRQGLGPAEIGAFVASLSPWAFKWSGRSSTCSRPTALAVART
jgi:PAT family beta-lactamase induction signal transducer AmpG